LLSFLCISFFFQLLLGLKREKLAEREDE